MSWQDYVTQKMKGRTQVEVASGSDFSQAAVSRWKDGKQGVDALNAIAFARAVGDHPLNALVAAKFISEEEAKLPPAAAPDLTKLTNDELLEEVRARMREEGELGGDTAATKAPDLGPGGRKKKYPAPVKDAARGEDKK